MKGAPRQAKATLNSETSFWSSGEFFWWQTRCKLSWQPAAIFSIHFILYWISFLYLLLLYLVLMISNERKNRPSDSLNSPHTLCPCHLIDRCRLFLFSLSPTPHKAIHLLPLSLLGAEWWVFDISVGYLEANELGGLHWLQEHLPLLSEDT